MPHVLVRRNMEKIRGVLDGMERCSTGSPAGSTRRPRRAASARRTATRSASSRGPTRSGVVLPSNSPGVHALWLPAVAIKMPLVIKPGSAEPWTPYRIVQAFLRPARRRRRSATTRPTTPVAAEILRHTRPRHALRRRGHAEAWRAIRGSRCTDRATARWCSAPTARRLAAVPRRDGRVDPRERRPIVRQRLGHLGAGARRRDRRGSRRAAGGGRARGPADDRAGADRAVRRRAASPRGSRGDRRGLGGRRRAGRDRARTGRAAGWSTRAAAPTCCRPIVRCDDPDHPLANRSTCSRSPAWSRCAGRDARTFGPTLVVTAITEIRRCCAGCVASPLRRSAERRRRFPPTRDLGPAARGQSVRAPVWQTGLSAGCRLTLEVSGSWVPGSWVLFRSFKVSGFGGSGSGFQGSRAQSSESALQCFENPGVANRPDLMPSHPYLRNQNLRNLRNLRMCVLCVIEWTRFENLRSE